VIPLRRWLPVVFAAVAFAPVAAQEFGPPAPAEYGKAPKLDVQPFASPTIPVRFEYPRKDWEVVLPKSVPPAEPGASRPIVSIVQRRREAAIVVEQEKLHRPLAEDDLTELFGQLEGDAIHERQPLAKEILPKVVQAGSRRLVIVTYSRQVAYAGTQRVRQYSMLAGGAALFRLTCSAPTAQFSRYEPVFAHVAASFSATGGGTQ